MVAAKLLDTGTQGRQRIDRYELVAEIATGGMATVYLARLSGMGGFQRFLAIKRLHPHLARENEFVEMFLDEARLAAGIHHPNVVPILEVGASDQHGYYLVMEYIEGDTLARLLARAATSGSKLPIQVGIRIALDMLQGLHAAHELRDENDQPTELVHRDVSPQNVLVGVDGSARITDFGVARAASRLSATRVGQLKGKIAYMSPEQASGSVDVDRRADVFSAGIVLWEVLVARRLFKSETEAATLSRVMSDPIPYPTDVAPDVPAEVADVCMRALARDVDERFATCAELVLALEEAAQKHGLIASPRDTAAYVSEVLGNEIAQQREAVRAWLARSEPSQAMRPQTAPLALVPPNGVASSVSAVAMEVPSSPDTEVGPAPLTGIEVEPAFRSRKRPVVLGGVAVLLFGVLAGATVVLVSGPDEGSTGDSATGPTPSEATPAAQATPTPAAESEAVSEKEASKPPSEAERPEEPPEPDPPKDPPTAAAEEAKAAKDEKPSNAGRPVSRTSSGTAGGRSAPAAAAPAEADKAKPKKPAVDLSNPYR